MLLFCFDIEGVLFPELWPEISKITGIKDFLMVKGSSGDVNMTLRQLNQKRIEVMKNNHITSKDIKNYVSKIEPYDGAKDFIQKLRDLAEVILITDSAYQLSSIAVRKINSPSLISNAFIEDKDGNFIDFDQRIDTKANQVKAFQNLGYNTIACGDSEFDVSMIKASKAGYLFRSTEDIIKRHTDIKSYNEYNDLYEDIVKVIKNNV